jgi:hypothetical protein
METGRRLICVMFYILRRFRGSMYIMCLPLALNILTAINGTDREKNGVQAVVSPSVGACLLQVERHSEL